MTDKTMSYEDMNLDQLERAKHKLVEEKVANKECLSAVAMILDRKISEVNAQQKVAAMSEPERAALLQVLQPEGIEPTEAVNVS